MRFVAVSICLMFCAGCVTGPLTGKKYFSFLFDDSPNWGYYEEVREAYIKNHPDISENRKNAILNQEIMMGMTEDEVRVSWALFGSRSPRVNRSVGSWGTHEQWITPGHYLYFRNGVLTSWQNRYGL